jgi:hypothetical protein
VPWCLRVNIMRSQLNFLAVVAYSNSSSVLSPSIAAVTSRIRLRVKDILCVEDLVFLVQVLGTRTWEARVPVGHGSLANGERTQPRGGMGVGLTCASALIVMAVGWS